LDGLRLMKDGTMKSLEQLLVSLLADMQGKTSDTDRLLDIRTIQQRMKDEGDSFVTITLPGFAQDFERSLEQRRVDPNFLSAL